MICKLVSFYKEQNPPDQLRDIDRGGDVVVHTLMPVFIFRGKVVVLGEDKERQKPDRGILHLEHLRHKGISLSTARTSSKKPMPEPSGRSRLQQITSGISSLMTVRASRRVDAVLAGQPRRCKYFCRHHI